MTRQLARTVTAQKPFIRPLSECNRKPGKSIWATVGAALSVAKISRSLAACSGSRRSGRPVQTAFSAPCGGLSLSSRTVTRHVAHVNNILACRIGPYLELFESRPRQQLSYGCLPSWDADITAFSGEGKRLLRHPETYLLRQGVRPTRTGLLFVSRNVYQRMSPPFNGTRPIPPHPRQSGSSSPRAAHQDKEHRSPASR